MSIWPRSFEIWNYSRFGLATFWVFTALGISVAALLGRSPWERRFTIMVTGLGLSGVAVHAACIVTLQRDPRRDLGFVPLLSPLGSAAKWVVLALAIFTPLLVPFLILRFGLSRQRPSLAVLGPLVFAMLYAAYVAPWGLDVLFD